MEIWQKELAASVIARVAARSGKDVTDLVRMSLASMKMADRQSMLWDEEKHPRDESGQFSTKEEVAAEEEESEWDGYDKEEKELEALSWLSNQEFEDIPEEVQDKIIDKMAIHVKKNANAISEEVDFSGNEEIFNKVLDTAYSKYQEKYEAAVAKGNELIKSDNYVLGIREMFEVAPSNTKESRQMVEEGSWDLFQGVNTDEFYKLMKEWGRDIDAELVGNARDAIYDSTSTDRMIDDIVRVAQLEKERDSLDEDAEDYYEKQENINFRIEELTDGIFLFQHDIIGADFPDNEKEAREMVQDGINKADANKLSELKLDMVDEDDSLSNVEADVDSFLENEEAVEVLHKEWMKSERGQESVRLLTEFGKSAAKVGEESEGFYESLNDGKDARDLWDEQVHEYGSVEIDYSKILKPLIKEDPRPYAVHMLRDGDYDDDYQAAGIGELPYLQEQARRQVEAL